MSHAILVSSEPAAVPAPVANLIGNVPCPSPIAGRANRAPVGPGSRPVAIAAVVRLPTSVGDVDRLLARTASGDRAAFEQLHRVTRPRLLGLALRVLGDRANAEEALQEAYLTIWQRASQHRPHQGSGLGWMSAIVRNRAIDQQRRLLREPFVCTDVHVDAVETAARDFDERVEVIGPVMARLSLNHRAALRAAYFQGLSHREVADRLGVPLGTAKSWIRRGLSELREMLEPSMH